MNRQNLLAILKNIKQNTENSSCLSYQQAIYKLQTINDLITNLLIVEPPSSMEIAGMIKQAPETEERVAQDILQKSAGWKRQ